MPLVGDQAFTDVGSELTDGLTKHPQKLQNKIAASEIV